MSEQNSCKIAIMENGPLIVNGVVEVVGPDGKPMESKAKFALCRCGQSQNKPFCDGTHSKIEFSGAREIDKPLDKVRAYQGQKITIHDNRTICCHAEICVKELKGVFDAGKKPWIDPDGDSVQKIIDTVNRCPSGALSYSISQEDDRDQEQAPLITIQKGGPYDVAGDIELDGEHRPPISERYSLCRCGASKNKPFCDGSHHDITFDV